MLLHDLAPPHRPRARLGFAVRALLAIPLLGACIAASAAAKERPYVGRTPAYVCFFTTLTDEGHMKQSRLIRTSGSLPADRKGTYLMRRSKFLENTGLQEASRDVYVYMRLFANGKFTLKVYELDDPLPDMCKQEPETPEQLDGSPAASSP